MHIFESLGIEPVNAGACSGPGKWASSPGTGTLESINPATGEVIGKVRVCSDQDYEEVLNESVRAFQEWRMVPAPKRGEVVHLLGQAIRDHKDALGSLVAMEVGKIKEEGDGEVQEMIDMADLAVGQSRMLYGKTMHSERPSHRMYEQWHPLGVVGVISAFNFPVAVWAWNACLAAIAGDTVVWKPSPKAPLCAIAIQNLCNAVMEASGYPGIFSLLITDQISIAERLVQDKRAGLISFTGSVSVGRHVSQLVARRLGKSLLELGGNNAIIVDETADLDLAIPAIVFGAVGTAGQRCTTTRRLFVHESLHEEVLARLVRAYQSIVIGDPLDRKVLMGPLIDEAAVAHFQETIDEISRNGGTIVHGGKRLKGKGYFVEPTLVRAQPHWDIIQRETFAPILYVIPFKSLDEAIEYHNAAPQGLSSALFTTDLRCAEAFLSATGSDCGIANINIGTSGAEIGGAFGGEKETGGGREAGSDAWKTYMRRQTSTINWGHTIPLAQGIKFSF